MSWESPPAPPMIRHSKQWNHLLDALDHTEYLTAAEAEEKAEITHRRAQHCLFVAALLNSVEKKREHKRFLYRLNGKPIT